MPIVFSSDNNYLPIVVTAIESIVQNLSVDDNNLDILIFDEGIEADRKKILIENYKNYNHIQIRFIDMLPVLVEFPKLWKMRNKKLRYPVNFFYKVLIPFVLTKYEKILFLDADIVACKDISQLFHVDICSSYLGAVPDIVMKAWVCNPELQKKFYYYVNSTWKDYLLKKIGLTTTDKYFNTGIILFNLEKYERIFLRLK